MITLRQACDELGVGYRTLEKYMRRLEITPARHPIDCASTRWSLSRSSNCARRSLSGQRSGHQA